MPSAFRRATWVAPVCAVLLAAPAAVAGPIEWDYTAHVRTATGLGTLNLGTYRLSTDPSGNGTAEPVFGDYVITAPLPEATFSGSYPIPGGDPNDAIRLFWIGNGFQITPAADAPPSDPTFRLTFTVTDRASGQTGTVEFNGHATVSAGPEYNAAVLFTADMWSETKELTLGGNRYRVTPVGGMPDELDEPALLGVRVEATAATPEPATLALAGVGIGAVGLRRARRRLTGAT